MSRVPRPSGSLRLAIFASLRFLSRVHPVAPPKERRHPLPNSPVTMPKVSKRRARNVFLFLLAPALLLAWIFVAPWPDPEHRPIPWVPDAIVVLGGGEAGGHLAAFLGLRSSSEPL